MTDHSSNVEQRRSGLQRSRNVAIGSLGWTQAKIDWHLSVGHSGEFVWSSMTSAYNFKKCLHACKHRCRCCIILVLVRLPPAIGRAPWLFKRGFFIPNCLQSDLQHQKFNPVAITPLPMTNTYLRIFCFHTHYLSIKNWDARCKVTKAKWLLITKF